MLRFCAVVCVLLSLFSGTAALHSGGTDGKGGHYDQSTGTYHYHHGYPAHQHKDTNGDGKADCPYDFKKGSSYYNDYDWDFDLDFPEVDVQTQPVEDAAGNLTGADVANGFVIVSLIVIAITALLLAERKRFYQAMLKRNAQEINKAIAPVATKAPDLDGLRPILRNYAQVDDVIYKEKTLRQQLLDAQRRYDEISNKAQATVKKISYVNAASLLVLLTIFVYFISEDIGAVGAFLVSLVISLLIMWFVICRCTWPIEDQIRNEKEQTRKQIEFYVHKLKKELVESYSDRSAFLDIPERFFFLDKYPSDSWQMSAITIYGSLTRFVTSYAGKHFHDRLGCCGASNPVCLYQVLLEGKYEYCSKCATNDASAVVPDWYKYHLKLDQIESTIEEKIK